MKQTITSSRDHCLGNSHFFCFSSVRLKSLSIYGGCFFSFVRDPHAIWPKLPQLSCHWRLPMCYMVNKRLKWLNGRIEWRNIACIVPSFEKEIHYNANRQQFSSDELLYKALGQHIVPLFWSVVCMCELWLLFLSFVSILIWFVCSVCFYFGIMSHCITCKASTYDNKSNESNGSYCFNEWKLQQRSI